MTDRRDFLSATLLSAALAGSGIGLPAWSATQQSARRPQFKSDPFGLGVASGYPVNDGIVLWTRLATQPTNPEAHQGEYDLAVHYEISEDAHFSKVIQSGVTRAEARYAHSVHLEVRGLKPGRDYFYRFRAGDYVSSIGRTWTSPLGERQAPLQIAVASCQHYEQGYFHAYSHMIERGTDLIIHVGDYIYEGNTSSPVRRHDIGECKTLNDYRLRYAWYRSDPVLRAAHAHCPWLVTHDDHEVDNDYAGLIAEHPDGQAEFAARRAAAYQAYWEHMPLPRSALPRGNDMQLYMTRTLGDLLAIHMLDERQYRSPQVCPTPPRLGGGSRVYVDACPSWNDESRSILGATQEGWIDAQLRASNARWNFIAQGVVMTLIDEDPGPRQQHWSDSWAGYPAARRRMLESIASSGCKNPVMLGGDIHAFIVADQRLVPHDNDSPLIASEIVTTSITSGPPPQKVIDAYNRPEASDVFLADGAYRGYARLTLTPARLEAELIGYASVREPEAVAQSLARFVIEDSRPGLQRA
ncbi:MAG: alkaline phosphatase [Gammaproteobacteria bacterium]|nr:alkaline phosphatase [Gammaproteobacteria bacterium]